MQQIDTFESLLKYIETFISSDDLHDEVIIDDNIRRSMRETNQIKQTYSILFYFAYVIPTTPPIEKTNVKLIATHRLVLSKIPFRVEFMDLSHKAKNIFINDTGLKMHANADIDTIKKMYTILDLGKWFDVLNNVMLHLGSEQDFISKSYSLRSDITKYITKSPKYKEWADHNVVRKQLKWLENPMIQLNDSRPMKSTCPIYVKPNDKAYFISIDLKMANFQVLRNHGLIESATWSEFMSKFVDHSYFANAKIARMKNLSEPALLPAKQKICWENTMIDMVNSIIDNNILTKESFAKFNSDEIIFHTTKETMASDKLVLSQFVQSNFPSYETSISIFQIHLIDPKKNYYMKINQESMKEDFKCVHKDELYEAVMSWQSKKLII